MERQTKAYLFGLITVFLWSTVASAFKLTLQTMDPGMMLLYSCIVSIGTLTGVLTVQGRLHLIFQYSPRQYCQSLGLGLLNPFLYYVVLFKAYDLLPAQEAQPLNYTWALTLAFLSIFILKQKIGWRDLIATLLCYSGIWVISTRGNVLSFQFSSPLGVVLALGSTIIWALYWIYNTKDQRDPVAGLLLNFLFGLPFIFLYCVLFSNLAIPEMKGLLGAAYVGVFEMGITYVTWLTALKLSTNTSKVGNLIFISPFFSLIFIRFLLKEAILPSTIIGLILIVSGLIFQKYQRVKVLEKA